MWRRGTAKVGVRDEYAGETVQVAVVNAAVFALLKLVFAAERGRVLPAMLFCFVWMTLVYCPLACWAWNINGWAFTWGALDYAGEYHGPIRKTTIGL